MKFKLFQYSPSYSNTYLFIVAIETAAAILINLFFAAIFAADSFGEFITILNLCHITSTILELGLPIYIQRESSKNNLTQRDINLSLIYKMFTLPIYFAAILSIYISISQSPDYLFLIIISLTVFINSLSRIYMHFNFGKVDFISVLKASSLSKVSIFITITVLFLLSLNSRHYIFLICISAITQLLYLYLKSELKLDLKISGQIKEIIALLRKIWYLGLLSLVLVLNDRIDIILINSLLSNVDAANYSISFSAYKFSGIILSVIWVPALTFFSKYNVNSTMFSKSLFTSLAQILLISLVLIIFNLLALPYIITLIYGGKYLIAVNLIPMFSYLFFTQGVAGLLGTVLTAQKFEKYVLIAVLMGLFSNVLINLFLLKSIGIEASLLARNISDSTILLMELVFLIIIIKKSVKIEV